MPSDQQIDFAAMVLIIREALVHLRFCQAGEAIGADSVHSLAVLEKADDVMNPNARVFNNGIAATNAWNAHDVLVSFGSRAHVIKKLRRSRQIATESGGTGAIGGCLGWRVGIMLQRELVD